MRSVSHRRQQSEADCLPVCVQIVLDYLGLSIAYKQLIRLLETKSFGTPFRNIKRLEQFNLSVQIEHLALTEMSDYLAQGLPVIACVHTADLSYWSQTVDHVVVVVEVDAQHVSVHDPVLDDGPHLVPRTEFELAQLHYDYLCAIVRK